MTQRGEVLVGTSGWRYDHWWGTFYPEDLAKANSLAYYAGHLPAVEVNRTFYSLPAIESVSKWRDAAPPGFRFAVKASRYITHMKKLKDPEEPLARLYEVVNALGDAAGPVLFQLPPRWNCDPERLESFLEALPDSHPVAFEFRDPSWFDDRIYGLLADHTAAFCIWDLAGQRAPSEVTSNFVYLRLHGPGEEAYTGRYDRRELGGWAGACHAWVRTGHDVWCFFDNDQSGHAPRNALELQTMVAG